MEAMIATKICTLKLLKEIILIDLKTKQIKWLQSMGQQFV
jgi:hypothetical protein